MLESAKGDLNPTKLCRISDLLAVSGLLFAPVLYFLVYGPRDPIRRILAPD
jgi:hypothetical protein